MSGVSKNASWGKFVFRNLRYYENRDSTYTTAAHSSSHVSLHIFGHFPIQYSFEPFSSLALNVYFPAATLQLSTLYSWMYWSGFSDHIVLTSLGEAVLRSLIILVDWENSELIRSPPERQRGSATHKKGSLSEGIYICLCFISNSFKYEV